MHLNVSLNHIKIRRSEFSKDTCNTVADSECLILIRLMSAYDKHLLIGLPVLKSNKGSTYFGQER